MSRPNVLVITCHDLGRHLSCYGASTVQSPALDKLAASGVRLDAMYCTAPQCSPSRASLHTGRYPHATGVLGLAHPPFGWRLDPAAPHLAQMLGEQGYRTALSGIQHLIARGQAEELGFETVQPPSMASGVSERALALMAELAADERPFYLEIGFEEPHRPYAARGVEPDDSLGVEIPPYLPETAEARQDLAGFQGAIKALDAGVGQVLRGLDELGLRDNTWVIFCSDHGTAMPRAKCTLYDPGLEISFLMRWPGGGLGEGRTYDHLLSNVDLVPTVLEGLGIEGERGLQGRSFWTLLSGGDYQERREIFAEKTYHTYYEPMRAIRTKTHKLIVNLEVGTAIDVPTDIRESPIYPQMLRQINGHRRYLELYDLAADPWEQRNLIGEGGTGELEAELRQRLAEWMSRTGDPLLAGPVASPYYHEALRQLQTGADPEFDEHDDGTACDG